MSTVAGTYRLGFAIKARTSGVTPSDLAIVNATTVGYYPVVKTTRDLSGNTLTSPQFYSLMVQGTGNITLNINVNGTLYTKSIANTLFVLDNTPTPVALARINTTLADLGVQFVVQRHTTVYTVGLVNTTQTPMTVIFPEQAGVPQGSSLSADLAALMSLYGRTFVLPPHA